MKDEINSIKDLLYSGQEVNVDLAISIMQGLGLTWSSKGFEDEKKIVDLCGVNVFSVTTVDLMRRELSVLPSFISQLQNLKVLYLRGNKISSIPKSIGQLQQLKTIDFRGNKISSMPESIGQLQQLTQLDLYANQLNFLPTSISKLKQLKWLWLSGNPISRSEINRIKTSLPNCNVIY